MMVGDVVNVVSGPCAGMVGVVLEAKSQVIYVNLRKNAGSAVPFGPQQLELKHQWLAAEAI